MNSFSRKRQKTLHNFFPQRPVSQVASESHVAGIIITELHSKLFSLD